MRKTALLIALALSVSGSAFAQEWTEYTNKEEGFKVSFPGVPKVTETQWMSQFEYTLPAKVFSAERGRERYSVTVVDYHPIEQLGMARRKACPPGAEPSLAAIRAVQVSGNTTYEAP